MNATTQGLEWVLCDPISHLLGCSQMEVFELLDGVAEQGSLDIKQLQLSLRGPIRFWSQRSIHHCWHEMWRAAFPFDR
jgi:hypothetical protein